ncbi:hypothetical protein ACJ41O_007467 [Fusarium nematophilum]
MLVLIAGITGMCGQACAQAALQAGHRVRGLSRNPNKLDPDIFGQLEGFVKMKDMYDTGALDQAVQGVDAIIAAMHYSPESVLEGQLFLLRAAERAGVKTFHAASWNYDWTRISLGEAEPYDPYIAFRNQARLSSNIKPIYGITGGLLDSAFIYSPHGSPIDKKNQEIPCFGTGSERGTWTAVEDVAKYTIQAISEPNAAEGGAYRVESFRCSWQEFAQAYNDVRGTSLRIKSLGTLEDVHQKLDTARATIPANKSGEYVGLVFAKLILTGACDGGAADCARWSHIKPLSLQEWLKKHPDV